MNAIFYDGKSAINQAVTLLCVDECLHIYAADGTKLGFWYLQDISMASHTSLPLRIKNIKRQEWLIIEDQGCIAELLPWLTPTLKAEKKHTRRVMLKFFAAVWLLAGLLYMLFPYLSDAVVYCVPRSYELGMGEQAKDGAARLISKTFTGEIPWVTNGEGLHDLEEMIQKLSNADDNNGYNFIVQVLDDDFINAFALPGGYIIVTTGIIQYSDSPDELAAVIAHEMAHVTQRHNTRQLIRMEIFSFIASLFTDGTELMRDARTIGTFAVTTTYSRKAETEADLLGVRRLNNAGINPVALATFFSRLAPDNGSNKLLDYFSTHPSLTARQKYINEAAEKRTTPYSPALSSDAWGRLKKLSSPYRKKTTEEKVRQALSDAGIYE